MKNRAEFVGIVLLILMLGACSAAAVEETAVSIPANTLPPTNQDHEHAPDEPEHVHLDDGSILSTQGSEPLQDDIWSLLLAGDPIMVGVANDSVETAVFTVPTMF